MTPPTISSRRGAAGPSRPGTGGSAGATGATVAIGAVTPGNPDVQAFLDVLESPEFSIESQVSEREAAEAIHLFSIVNIMLGGRSRYKVGDVEKTDVIGVLTLFYGLQDKSLPRQIVVRSSQLWDTIQADLKTLRDDLDVLGADADFLMREAKRQFNLGLNNDVPGNTAFPGLFKRYVEIVTDPILSIDIRVEQGNGFFDKEKLARAFDLLRELKSVILQLVRSLSKYGTVATGQANADWARYEGSALDVLRRVAEQRISDDQDDLNPWSVLADLVGKDRDREISPYVALGRDGGELLELALITYLVTKDQLDNFDDQHLLNLFQTSGQPFLTTRMRDEATVIKRYPLANWG